MIVAMFRTYLKPQANLDELGVLHQKMHAIVTNMPGFISVKMFTAEDGEVLALAEFDPRGHIQGADRVMERPMYDAI
jgi:hypothetical protein